MVKKEKEIRVGRERGKNEGNEGWMFARFEATVDKQDDVSRKSDRWTPVTRVG